MKHAFFLGFHGLKIWYPGVFGVADYRSILKIRKFIRADPIWRTKMQKVNWLGLNLVLSEFWSHWLRIWVWNSEIENGGPKCKITWLGWNLILGGLWVTDYESEFKIQRFKMTDSIWRQQIQEMTWSGWNSVLGELNVQKWKMAAPIKCQKYKRWLDWEKNRFLVFFKIPDSKSELKSEIKNKITKNKKPVWQTKIWISKFAWI